MKDDQAFRLEQAQNVGLGFELKAQLVSMQEVEVVEVKAWAAAFAPTSRAAAIDFSPALAKNRKQGG
jgi:hypothetical protein